MNIEDAIKNILVNELFIDIPPAAMGLDDGLRDQIGLDSLGFTELRAQSELTFDVTISDEDFVPKHFTSINTLTALVTQLQQAKQAA